MNQMATRNVSFLPATLPFDPDQSSVSKWLQNLPDTGTIETCKFIFATLAQLNRHDLAIRVRFAILEHFRPVVLLQSSHLTTRLSGSIFPLQPKSRKIAKLAAKFHSELGSGYRVIANHADFEESFSSYEQALVVYRIVGSLAISLLRIAQTYQAPAPKIWHLLKKFYCLAESRELFYTKVQDPMAAFPNSSTIAGTLATAVLFFITNPYRYSRLEMDQLYRYFDRHGDQIEWLKVQGLHNRRVFGFDLENSLAPRHGSWWAKVQPKSFRGFDTANCWASRSAPDTNQADPRSGLNESILSRVSHHLGNPGIIKFNHPGSPAELTLGLEKIVALLQLKDSKLPTKVSQPLPSVDWQTSQNYELVPLSNDQWARKHSERSDLSNHLPGSKAVRNPGPQAKAPDDIWTNSPQTKIGSSRIECNLHQSELSGHVLVKIKLDSLPVGQIIAITIDRSPIQFGVIRWIQTSTHDQYFYYGVEKLPAKCSLANVFISSRQHTNVLFFKKNVSGYSEYDMIMPAAHYDCGTHLTVKQPHGTKSLVLEKLLETSPFFCHYSLKELHHLEQSAAKTVE